MNYQDFIKSIAQTVSMSQKDAEQLAAALGTLELKTKAARRMYSPNVKDYVEVPESKTIAFKPTSEMKDKVKSTKE